VKTYHAKTGEVEREWLLVDATDLTLGRLASELAQILKGKRKPQYTPHIDTGDFVIVVNAASSPTRSTSVTAASPVGSRARPSGTCSPRTPARWSSAP
jgi:large subunit ribosomal protein L13